MSPGNTKGGSITVPLTSCLTGLDLSVLQIKKIVCCHTADSKPVKQEVKSTVILPPLVFPWCHFSNYLLSQIVFSETCSFEPIWNCDKSWTREYWRGKYHCTIELLFDWFGISCMTTDNFCFYVQNIQIQTSQIGSHW